MALSNGTYVEVIQVPPLQDAGWEVRVVPYTDFIRRLDAGDDGQPIAIISKYIEITISLGINEVGAGSVTLDLDDEFWDRELGDGAPASQLLEYEHLWQIYENGLLRGEFLGQSVREEYLAASETRGVVISGPLGGDVLRWAVVMTPQFPNGPSATELNVYQFTNIPIMSAYLQLIGAAQSRGTIQFVRANFNHSVDSAGQVWADTPVAPAVTQGNTVTVLSGDVNFAFDSYALTAAAYTNIAAMVARFAGASPQVTCVGHADWIGSIAYNQTISVNRANAVANQIRVLAPHAVVRAWGMGETQPIATNSTAAGRALNRRVTVTYPVYVIPPAPTNPVYGPPLGMNLLDLLNEWAGLDPDKLAPIRVEWMMRPGFQLDVRRQFGTRRETEVTFYDGSAAAIGKDRQRTRAEIANLVAVQSDYGDYSVASDATSIARWRQRELFKREDNAFDAVMRGGIAAAKLELAKDEKASWTIKVEPYDPGRRVFEDYHVGDWIGISRYRGSQPNTVEAHRVMAVTLSVNADAEVDLELTLQNRFEARAYRLQAQITSLINHQADSARVFVQDQEPYNASVGDLWTPRN